MDIEEEIKKFMRALLGNESSEKKLDDGISKLKTLAFEEWANWIIGIYRPTSLSENTSDRIFKIYTSIKGDIPKIEEIVNYFNIPSGRAKYIISVLKYSGHPKLQELVRGKLKKALEEEIKGKEDHENITPFIEKAILDELSFLENEILYKDKNQDYEKYEELEGRRSFGIECKISVKSAKLIIAKLEDLLSTMGE